MNWLISLLIAFLTAVLGLFSVGALGAGCVSWYRISSFEGKSGYFVISLALLGGIVGFVIGLVTAYFIPPGGTGLGFLKSLGCAWGAIVGLAGLAAGICWLRADIAPKIGGQELMLEVEFRLPVGETNLPAADKEKSFIEFGSVVNHRRRSSRMGELRLADAKLVDGRWVVPGSVYLYTMRGMRVLEIQLEGKPREGFMMPLPARPGKEFEQWSDWLPRSLKKVQPWPDTKSSYRFRVERIVPPPPPPDPAVVEAEGFAALKPDAPLAEWLGFLHYDSPPERVTAVMTVVEGRQPELAQMIISTNAPAREAALGAVPKLSAFSPEISEAVQAEARAIASGIRRFNEMKADDPEFYNVQVEWRTRFNYWKQAWWTMHQRLGLDGRPPVQEIFDLATVRAKGTSMDEIVLNSRVILEALNPASPKSP